MSDTLLRWVIIPAVQIGIVLNVMLLAVAYLTLL